MLNNSNNENKCNNNMNTNNNIIIPLSINTYFDPEMQFCSHNHFRLYTENLELGSCTKRMISPSHITVNIKQNWGFIK
jgi:hypothetical protein